MASAVWGTMSFFCRFAYVLRRFLCCLLLLGCFFAGPATGVETPGVRDLALLVDPTGEETIASVAAPAAAGRFRPVGDKLVGGYSKAAHWLRFTVQAPHPGPWWLEVQPPFIDDLRLYVPDAPEGGEGRVAFREQRGGDRQAFAEREIAYRAFVVPLSLPDSQPRTFYLRLHTSSSALAYLKLWSPRDFQAAKTVEIALLGAYFGLMATLLVINLLYWYWLRDALHGFFCLHVAVLALLYFGANGFAAQLLFADHPRAADLWVSFFVLASLAAAAPFYRRILRIERDRPRLWWFYRVQVALPLLAMPSLVLGYYSEVMRVLVVFVFVTIVVALVLAYGLWRRGGREGLVLLVGVAISLLGALPLILTMLGLFPGELWLLHIRQSTMVGSVLAMHLAVATRMRGIADERREALARARQAELRAREECLVQEQHRQFLALLTHELRTPLSVIDGAVQSLEYLQQPEDAATRLRHRRIRRSVARIDGLLRQFLAKDKVDDARLTVQPVALDALAQARLAIESSAEGAVERVQLVAPGALPFCGDPALVQVALGNLIDNALKYSPQDTEVAMEVEARPRDGRPGVAWTIADRGAGFDAATCDAVFGKYVRGPAHGHLAGTGLGLYLVRRIAELHGGAIEIVAREGWGAVLRLWLPAPGDAEPAALAAVEGTSAVGRGAP